VLQQARKNAGLEVSDRIKVRFASTDEEVLLASHQHKQSIADEVLAVEFVQGEAGESAELNGRPVRYSIAKA
jgi:isoleucyl-tRNA synthetase